MPSIKGPSRDQALGAVSEFRRRIQANPHDSAAYRALARALRYLGAADEANQAEIDAIAASEHDPEIQRASKALLANKISDAEAILRSIISRRPDEVVAIGMLAGIALRTGFTDDAERLARHALALSPSFPYAHYILAAALNSRGRADEALRELDQIASPLADLDETIALRAAVLGKLGDDEGALGLYQALGERRPEAPGMWLSIGDHLRALGKTSDAIAAYKRELQNSPGDGEAWWSIANIKTFRFKDDDIEALETALKSDGISRLSRSQLHFALGKALEDRGNDESAFEQYSRGNAIIAANSNYDRAETKRFVDQVEQLFTSEFLESRRSLGSSSQSPIFILGLTRSGSTLIEQILSSHSSIEGLGELPEVILLAKELEQSRPGSSSAGWCNYPALLADLSGEDLLVLGQTYLDRTSKQRKTARPFFTDKMPNNWVHIGLIRLMLPNAKIIDARRHPLACGFSNFRQFYAEGQQFTYDLADLGSYYRDYARLVGHFETIAPGSIHRVIHERLLVDPGREISNLLEFLGLPFEDACMRFYETQRPVRTVSAEQVRRPIDSSRMDEWKRFERWLGPLKESLGSALEHWDR